MNKIIGDQAESSIRRGILGLAECEFTIIQMKASDLFTLNSEDTLNVPTGEPKSTENTCTILKTHDINLKELINPCDKMKSLRTERRMSERLQANIMKPMDNPSSLKRNLQGTTLLSQIFFCSR